MSEKCKTQVADSTGFHFWKCGRNAKYFEGGEHYCGTHAPSKIAERRAKRGPTRFELELVQIRKRQEEREAVIARIAELEADLWRVRDAYNELIMAVGMKFPDESRHQTALRYIRQREAGGSVQCAAKEGE